MLGSDTTSKSGSDGSGPATSNTSGANDSAGGSGGDSDTSTNGGDAGGTGGGVHATWPTLDTLPVYEKLAEALSNEGRGSAPDGSSDSALTLPSEFVRGQHKLELALAGVKKSGQAGCVRLVRIISRRRRRRSCCC